MKVVKVTFGDTVKKPMLMKFGTKAWMMIEELTGKPIDQLNMNNMSSMFIMVAAGLRTYNNKVTVDDVYEHIDNWAEKIAEEQGISQFEAMGQAIEELSLLLQEAMGTGEENPSE